MANHSNRPMFAENGDRQTGGFFPGIFTVGFDNKFLCSQCHCILRDPVQGYCGHRFCRSCRDELLSVPEIQSVDCPGCIEENVEAQEMGKITASQMFPDNAVRREMHNMGAACMYPRCAWRGKFRDYENHERQCQFRQIQCSQCAQPVTDGRLPEHRAKECSQRQVVCEHCRAQCVFSRLQAHHDTCDKFPLNCERCGQQNIFRYQMKEHKEKLCDKRSVVCPMGCSEQFSQDQFPAHLCSALESHLAWAMQRLSVLEVSLEGSGLSQQTQGLNQVKGDVNDMEKKFQSLDRQLKQLNLGKVSESQDTRAQGGAEAKSSKVSPEVAAKVSLRLIEPIIAVLHNEVDKIINSVQVLDGHFRQQQIQLDELETRLRAQQQSLSLVEALKSDVDMRLAAQEMARHDGTILWKISGFEGKKNDAIGGQTTSLYSPAFYSGPCGYKMCARIYPNGDGIGKNTHISLFFVIMRGHYDALLPWPFSQKVTLMMVDQNHKEYHMETFKPDPNSTSFKRPNSEMNIASGCPLFLPLDKLHSPGYGFLKEDTIFVKIIVDTEGLERYT